MTNQEIESRLFAAMKNNKGIHLLQFAKTNNICISTAFGVAFRLQKEGRIIAVRTGNQTTYYLNKIR